MTQTNPEGLEAGDVLRDRGEALRVGRAILDAHGQWETENVTFGSQEVWGEQHVILLGQAAMLAIAWRIPVDRKTSVWKPDLTPEQQARVDALDAEIGRRIPVGEGHGTLPNASPSSVPTEVVAAARAWLSGRIADCERFEANATHEGSAEASSAAYMDAAGLRAVDDVMSRLAALSASGPSGGGGREPIETAPKSTFRKVEGGNLVDGIYLLGFCPDEGADPLGCIEVVWWEPLERGGIWTNGHFECRPTHWQPLPEPPGSEAVK